MNNPVDMLHPSLTSCLELSFEQRYCIVCRHICVTYTFILYSLRLHLRLTKNVHCDISFFAGECVTSYICTVVFSFVENVELDSNPNFCFLSQAAIT